MKLNNCLITVDATCSWKILLSSKDEQSMALVRKILTHAPIGWFVVPERGDKVDSGIGVVVPVRQAA